MTIVSKGSEDLKNISTRLFLLQHIEKFNKYLAGLDNTSKHIIRNNKQLNELYDLFLDFIIDSSQHLDYIEAKEKENELSNK